MLPAFALLAACAGPARDSASSFALPSIALALNPHFTAVAYGYSSEEWIYLADLSAPVDAVTLAITQDTTSPWEEDHALQVDEGGLRWETVLPIIDGWIIPEEESTLFGNSISCENPYCETTMAWRLEATWNGERADCAVWAGSAADVAIVQDDGCREVVPRWQQP
jgi:hypothetical protein